jgi:zinc protease
VPAGPRTVTLADAKVEQPSLTRTYLVPSARTAAKGERAALSVLAHILGGGSSSLLYRALVIEQAIAVSASTWYQGTALDPSQFGISASPKPGVDFARLEAVIDTTIAAVADNGISAEQLEDAKTQLVAQTVYAQDNQAALARWYGASLTVGLGLDDVRGWPDEVRTVTAAQVRDAARKWLDKTRSVTGYLVKDTTPPKREEKRS